MVATRGNRLRLSTMAVFGDGHQVTLVMIVAVVAAYDLQRKSTGVPDGGKQWLQAVADINIGQYLTGTMIIIVDDYDQQMLPAMAIDAR